MLSDISGLRFRGKAFKELTTFQFFNEVKNEKQNVCLVYGKNGSGKSTISQAVLNAKGIYNLENNIPNQISESYFVDKNENKLDLTDEEKNRIFVFNENFVDSNIRYQEDGLQTIVIIGEQKNIEEKLEELLIEKGKLEDTYNKCSEEFNNYYCDTASTLCPDHYAKLMDDKLKGDNSWADRDRKITGKKVNTKVVNGAFQKFATRKVTKSRDELAVSFNEKLKDLENIHNGNSQIHINLSKVFVTWNGKQIEEILSKKIERADFTEREKRLLSIGSDQIRNMKSRFEDKSLQYCPYCMQTIDDEYREHMLIEISKVLNKEAENHAKELKNIRIDTVELANIENLEKYIDFKLVDNYKQFCRNLNSKIYSIQEAIQKKSENIYEPIEDKYYLDEALQDLNRSIETLLGAITEYNRSIDDKKIVRQLKNINDDIAYHDIIELYAFYTTQTDNKELYKNKMDTVAASLKQINDSIAELETQKKNVKIAIDVINQGLQYIFFSPDRLKLEYNNDGKYLLFSNGNPVRPADISVGERNIIALCYFFTCMMNNTMEKTIYSNDYVLVIDDPISSFDFENKVGIMSYLKYKLSRFIKGNKNTKLLFMTHDMQTYFDASKFLAEILQKGDAKFKSQMYELSDRKLVPYKNRKGEYTELVSLVYEYANNPSDDNDLIIGNAMRKVLEAYATFQYKKGITNVSTDPAILAQFESPFNTYFENLMYRLVLHGESHVEDRITTLQDMNFFDFISKQEKQRTAKDVLCFIYKLNKLHLLSHLGKDENERKNAENVLENWCNEIAKI